MRRWLAMATGALVVALSGAGATTEVGALGILTSVHGYNAGGSVLIPLRGLAEWLGAEVQYDDPYIGVAYGDTVIELMVGQRRAWVNDIEVPLEAPAKVYGGITCVPLRFIGESLGLGVSYHSRFSDESIRAGMLPVVVVDSPQGTNRIIVHGEPPDRVEGVIRGLQRHANALGWGQFGVDWVISIQKIHGGTADVFGPAFRADCCFSPTELSGNPVRFYDGSWHFPPGH